MLLFIQGFSADGNFKLGRRWLRHRSESMDGAKHGRSFRPKRGVISLTLVVCVSAALWSACREEATEQKEIRFGLLALLHGTAREMSGMPSVRGAELAVKTVNESGGVMLDGTRGRSIRCIASSTRCLPTCFSSTTKSSWPGPGRFSGAWAP